MDYSVFNRTQLANVFRNGVLVVRGKDWRWGTQGSNTIGNITQGLNVYSTAGWIQVRWQDGHLNSYRIGASGAYDLCRLLGECQCLTQENHFPWAAIMCLLSEIFPLPQHAACLCCQITEHLDERRLNIPSIQSEFNKYSFFCYFSLRFDLIWKMTPLHAGEKT